MKKLLVAIALVSCGIWHAFSQPSRNGDEANGLKVMIDIPLMDAFGWTADPVTHEVKRTVESEWKRVLRYSPHNQQLLQFYVVIQNVSTKPIILGSESTGGLYRDLAIEVAGEDGKVEIIRPLIPMASANKPETQLLDPGEATVLLIRSGATPGDPRAYPFYFKFPKDVKEPKVTLRAVFQGQAPDAFAKVGFWGGKAISEPCEVTIME